MTDVPDMLADPFSGRAREAHDRRAREDETADLAEALAARASRRAVPSLKEAADLLVARFKHDPIFRSVFGDEPEVVEANDGRASVEIRREVDDDEEVCVLEISVPPGTGLVRVEVWPSAEARDETQGAIGRRFERPHPAGAPSVHEPHAVATEAARHLAAFVAAMEDLGGGTLVEAADAGEGEGHLTELVERARVDARRASAEAAISEAAVWAQALDASRPLHDVAVALSEAVVSSPALRAAFGAAPPEPDGYIGNISYMIEGPAGALRVSAGSVPGTARISLEPAQSVVCASDERFQARWGSPPPSERPLQETVSLVAEVLAQAADFVGEISAFRLRRAAPTSPLRGTPDRGGVFGQIYAALFEGRR